MRVSFRAIHWESWRQQKDIIVAVPDYYNEFFFWWEANVIRRYLRRITFVLS